MSNPTVEIDLNGEKIELIPTLAAMEYLTKQVDNFTAVYGRLGAFNFDMYAHVIIAGVLPNKADLKTVRENVFRTGMIKLLPDLTRYVTLLLHGGKEPEVTEGDENNPEL